MAKRLFSSMGEEDVRCRVNLLRKKN